MKTYRFISTPGHGFLVVPLTDIRDEGFDSTQYSYLNDVEAYLEEDCDAPAFLWLLDKQGVEYKMKDEYSERDLPWPGMSRFGDASWPVTYELYLEAMGAT